MKAFVEPTRNDRQGTVLFIVLVVVTLLTLSAYALSERTILEVTASQSRLDSIQARAAAESAIAQLANWKSQHAGPGETSPPASVLNWQGFHQIQAHIVLPVIDGTTTHYATGVENPSSKINLNAIPVEDLDEASARKWLASIPQMTDSHRDCILDWLDQDDVPRSQGAETEDYQKQDLLISPANGPLTSFDELLSIRGITKELLYGEDGNRDGWIDANENDSGIQLPPDNADGILDRGWSEFLTVLSAESGKPAAHIQQIDLNQSNLVTLFDALKPKVGNRLAQFIVAYRLRGSLELKEELIEEIQQGLPRASNQSIEDRINDQLGISDSDDQNSESENAVRAGIDLSFPPQFRIRSLADLCGVRVRIDIDREDRILDSPWSSSPGSVDQVFQQFQALLTCESGERILGRLNINTASGSVLKSLSTLSNDQIDKMLLVRRELSREEKSLVTWPYRENIISLKELRALVPQITTGGDVLTGYAVGHIPNRATCRIRFRIDASDPAHVKIDYLKSDFLPVTEKLVVKSAL